MYSLFSPHGFFFLGVRVANISLIPYLHNLIVNWFCGGNGEQGKDIHPSRIWCGNMIYYTCLCYFCQFISESEFCESPFVKVVINRVRSVFPWIMKINMTPVLGAWIQLADEYLGWFMIILNISQYLQNSYPCPEIEIVWYLRMLAIIFRLTLNLSYLVCKVVF